MATRKAGRDAYAQLRPERSAVGFICRLAAFRDGRVCADVVCDCVMMLGMEGKEYGALHAAAAAAGYAMDGGESFTHPVICAND